MEFKLLLQNDPDKREITLTRDRTTFGRGSDADERFDDDGLSRLNSTVYQDSDRVWIVDEGSTNGTFVNGAPAGASGTPINDGDSIRLGNRTTLIARSVHPAVAAEPIAQVPPAANAAAAAPAVVPEKASMLPVILISGAIFVISISAVVIAFTAFGGSSDTAPANTEIAFDDPTPRPGRVPRASDSPTPAGNTVTDSDTPLSGTNVGPTDQSAPPSKKYGAMTPEERRSYVEMRAMKVAEIIGNSSSSRIPPLALDKIQKFVDGYFSRLGSKTTDGCVTKRPWADGLQLTYDRAAKNAPFIVRAFNEKGIDPRIGIYLAMIESEHCVCLQSGTGPLGMFQFTYATAKLHFIPNDGIVNGSTPSNPDDRCKPEPSARAAASYMRVLLGRFGTGPSSVPLAIGSYNSGEGGLSKNLDTALTSGNGLPRDFWTLIEKGDMLSSQFKSENFKYVPKFFAAAIIGEWPQDFGLTINPVSTYTK